MFTVEQIDIAHRKIKSGAEFPRYIQEIKEFGVTAFETWVSDSHTVYYGKDNFQTKSKPKYNELSIKDFCNRDQFEAYLRIHQKGETDYLTFCRHCAESGIEKWIVDLNKMTCIYYDKAGNEVLKEDIPTV
ncbi:DUF1398 domain-containing protein [Plebeiibacterium sediminum]|uniref:DUF1398 domain-containing protein n=1 Tax=Plebeiibacterium sediminum TaxID=2992112 RepID=A0AAE3SHW0_9BACT|nr:DUF1398 family protein [Plebeiobacterium sediminum]MCW3789692.1 DUF1398 domain-containing protein [Plebeiobacterium sediminum]